MADMALAGFLQKAWGPCQPSPCSCAGRGGAGGAAVQVFFSETLGLTPRLLQCRQTGKDCNLCAQMCSEWALPL